MALWTITKAVRRTLAEKMGIKDDGINIGQQGRPPANSGPVYYGVWGQDVGESMQGGMKEEYEVRVGVSIKYADVAPDAWEDIVYGNGDRAVEPHIRRIISWIDGQNEIGINVINLANSYLEDDQNGHIEPLFLKSRGKMDNKTASHWGATSGSWDYHGVYQEVYFRGGGRYQRMEPPLL